MRNKISKIAAFIIATVIALGIAVVLNCYFYKVVADHFSKPHAAQLQKLHYTSINIGNGCMINAEAFVDTYQAVKSLKKHWSKIVGIKLKGGECHAIAFIEYGGIIEIYDVNFGTWKAIGPKYTELLEAYADTDRIDILVGIWAKETGQALDTTFQPVILVSNGKFMDGQ